MVIVYCCMDQVKIVNKVDLIIVVLKITLFLGIQVVSVYIYNEPPTEYCMID